ncbi:MAG: hypothetical protein HY983_03340 [Candidatus Magasanikbacteria bacterium]|nr:hypothetical protein [Candidatus Magasanikbacteria bacterium]
MEFFFKQGARAGLLAGGVFSAAFSIFLAFPHWASAATELQYDGGYGYGLVTQTLTKAKSPYIVHGGCFAATKIPYGATVTVDPGVILKFAIESGCGSGPGHIGVLGNLFVNGTSEEPVIFTSIRDDSVGGDTSGDGSATVPRPGDWNDIEIISSSGANTIGIHNAIFRYGGFKGASIDIWSGTSSVTFENIELAYNAGFGIKTSLPLTLASSSFHDNLSGAINADNLWAPQVDARNNWWGEASGPSVAGNPGGHGQTFRGNVLYDPWIGKVLPNQPPALSFSSESGYQTDGVEPNIAFLSKLPTFKVVFADADNNPPTYVRIVIDGLPYDLAKDTGQDGIFVNGEVYAFTATSTLPSGQHTYHFETSDGIVTARLPASGELNFTLKNDPVIIIPGILGSEQKNGVWVIDPIFHTYDNLIDTFRVNGYADGVDLFTFPYQWRNSNVDTAVLLKDKIAGVKAICGCDKVDLVAHSMGGLVARQYIQSNYYAHDIDQLIFLGTPHLGAPNAYLTWEGGETGRRLPDRVLNFIFTREAEKTGYASLFDYVRHRPITSIEELLPIYDYLKDKSANTLRQYPNNYPRNQFLEELNANVSKLYDSGILLTNIVGDLGPSSTLNTVRVIDSPFLPLWNHGFPDGYDGTTYDLGMEVGSGDGTLPLKSSEFIYSDISVQSTEHTALPTHAESLIINKLAAIKDPELVNNWHFPNFKLLIIKILSPADIVVIAPDGKRVGKDFTIGQEVNQIDGAFYSGFTTDDEYITIPNPLDGEYKVETIGTGNGGEYTVAAGYISDDVLVSKDFQANTLPNMVSELKIDINSSTPQNLRVTPTDNVPPEITILSPLAQDYTRPFVLPLLVTATDTGSGVYSQSLAFDGKIATSSDMVDLFYLPLGIHTVMATATDFMGNVAIASTSFKLIASVTSTISDIERSYSLGWINNAGIKKSLIKKLQEIKKEDKKEKEDDERKHKKNEEKRKEEFKEFLQELKKQRGRHVNEQAFTLIQEDINWLINN